MFYPLPKKIQLVTTPAKWSLSTMQSVLLVIGLQQLQAEAEWSNSELALNVQRCMQKAKALDVPILNLDLANPAETMQRLGEQLSDRQQLVVTGLITPVAKQLLEHIHSVSEQICVINDAIALPNLEQHVQWIEKISLQHMLHMNTQSLLRLWSLSAPKEFILSERGILYAIAEALEISPLELDLAQDLQAYALDSVAVMSLVGLWRANGANISYEDVLHSQNLEKLIKQLRADS